MIKYTIGIFLFIINFSITIAQVDSVDLGEILVFPEEEIYKQKLLPSSVITLTIDDVLKLPATFFDPARLAQSYAGIANTNDQANGISIRGTNPRFMKWYMEGVEIVNPNHLSNAGTLSDRPTSNAGGVNILSAQLLNTTQLYKSNYPNMFSNALSGVMSMSLRPGSFQKNKHFAQIGLIGLEVGSEGPLNKEQTASYLVNYRYSTVGLLSAAGVDFGGESISFQDISYNFSFLTKKGILKFFGVAGYSENIFRGKQSVLERVVEKDRFNIDFHNKMATVGLSLAVKESKAVRYNTSLVFSGRDISRETRLASDLSMDISPVEFFEKELKLGLQYNLFYTLNSGAEIQMGLQISNTVFEEKELFEDIVFFGPIESNYWQPSMHVQYQTSAAKSGQFGIGARVKGVLFNELENQEITIEPNLNYSYLFNRTNRITFTAGLYSQVNPYDLYFFGSNNTTSVLSPELKQSKSANFVLSNQKKWSNKLSLTSELFYHYLYDIPITRFDEYSLLNEDDVNGVFQVENQGYGRSYGLEIGIDKKEINGLYYLVNGTLYDSKFKRSDGKWADTKFNGRYIFNTTIGKSWDKNLDNKSRNFGINFRVNYLGSLREKSINIERSNDFRTTIFWGNSPYERNASDYFRTDLSIYVVNKKEKFTSRLSLDIQNVLNRRNEGFAYYDPLLQRIERQQQLGILPVLNYRISF